MENLNDYIELIVTIIVAIPIITGAIVGLYLKWQGYREALKNATSILEVLTLVDQAANDIAVTVQDIKLATEYVNGKKNRRETRELSPNVKALLDLTLGRASPSAVAKTEEAVEKTRRSGRILDLKARWKHKLKGV